MELIIDNHSPRRTEIVKNTQQPKWNESFTVLVTPHSKLHFSVLDHNSFRKDTVIGEKKFELYQLLLHYNGSCENLELTLDLMSEGKQGDSPTKTGELMCILQGLSIEMSNHRLQNSGMPLVQSNSDTSTTNRSVLNGIRAKVRVLGTENMVPRHSRTDRNSLMASSHSSGNMQNGKDLLNTAKVKILQIFF